MKHTLGTLQLNEQDIQSAVEVIDSNWLSPGSKVKEFEEQFSSYHHQKYGVMVNSGTDALRIALAALKEQGRWKDGDVVFVPAVTFVATVNVVLQLNLTPKLVDVSQHDFTFNPYHLIRTQYTPDNRVNWPKNARCMIPVHLAGHPCDMRKILEIARTHKLKVLEDSCEAMGISDIAKGDVTAFSFYVAHILTTGVGGMATTNSRDLERLMWSYANHGRREAKKFQFDRVGYSCRATEFEASLGLNQLPKLEEVIQKRRENAWYLYQHLQPFADLRVGWVHNSAWMFFPVMLAEGSKLKKHKVMDHLAKRGIESRELMPLIDQPCYKTLWKTDNGLTVAKAVNERGFYIGCHQGMKQLEEVIEAFREVRLDKVTN